MRFIVLILIALAVMVAATTCYAGTHPAVDWVPADEQEAEQQVAPLKAQSDLSNQRVTITKQMITVRRQVLHKYVCRGDKVAIKRLEGEISALETRLDTELASARSYAEKLVDAETAARKLADTRNRREAADQLTAEKMAREKQSRELTLLAVSLTALAITASILLVAAHRRGDHR